jgi:hypothetical protein
VRPLGVESASETSRIDLQKVLASKKFVDLTYGFAPGIPAVVWFSRRTTQDEKQADLPLLPEDQNVLNAIAGKDCWSLDATLRRGRKYAWSVDRKSRQERR